MRKQRCDGQETRQKLLAAACEVFAAKGFRQATIAEICQKAKANSAAASTTSSHAMHAHGSGRGVGTNVSVIVSPR